MKKIITALLLISMLTTAFACSSGNGTGDDSDVAETTAAAQSESTDDGRPKPEIPDSDYNGQKYKILVPTSVAYEFVAEEETGEIVNDATYERNLAVEELLNVDLEIIEKADTFGDVSWNENQRQWNEIISSSIMAQDGAYDLINSCIVVTLPIASEGYFVNVNELEYVNFDNPWWLSSQTEKLSINGKLYGMFGDASLSLYKAMSVILFNAKTVENYSLGSPYELVRSGSWTADEMMSMSKDIYEDINGDGNCDENDSFGIITRGVPLRAFQTAYEIKMVDFDTSGTPYVVGMTDRLSTAIDKCGNYFKSDSAFNADYSTSLIPIFSEDRALFYADTLEVTDMLRDMDSDFGIIPYPKLDETQDEYHTQIGTATSMLFVPTTTVDLELTGKVCESLAYYGYEKVTPAYYELALKEKYTRDETTKEMLDIIRQSAMMDITFAYSTGFPGYPYPNVIFMTAMSKTSEFNAASFIASNETAWSGYIDTLVESYDDMK